MARTLESSRQNRARRLGSFVTQQWFKFAQRLSQALLIPIAILLISLSKFLIKVSKKA